MALSNLNSENVSRLMQSLYIDGHERERKMECVQHCSNVYSKISMLEQQIEQLHIMARDIVESGIKSQCLHSAQCGFVKTRGHMYHFYKNNDGVLYCSLLSPEDWKGTPPHEFYGSFLLDHDNEFHHKH